MTNEEARDVFKELKIGTFDGRLGITTKPNDLINASDIAIQAIERMIPKKPIFNSDMYHFCPVCVDNYDNPLKRGEMTSLYDCLIDRGTKYCRRCGQAMNWNDIT